MKEEGITEYKKRRAIKYKKNRRLIDQAIKSSIINKDDLPNVLAESWTDLGELTESFEELLDAVRDYEQVLSIFSSETKQPILKDIVRTRLLKAFEEHGSKAAKAINRGIKLKNISTAQRIANLRHSKPGGSREKKQKIRDIWASGKYSSRDICAEQECASLDMSFSTARKALRNTPDP